MSISEPPASAMRLPENSNSTPDLGSVQKELPEATGKFIAAGVHCESPRVWYDTVPVTRAKRPTRVGGSI